MRTERELDELYDRASPHLGWLSYLLEAHAIDSEEEKYLVWRDDCDGETNRRLKLWTDQVEREGGVPMMSAETPIERMNAVCSVIEKIERKAQKMTSYIAEAYRQLVGYRKFINLRAVIHLELDPPHHLPEWQIQRAREYRLEDLLSDRLKRRFMLCPVHPEKHGSFFVTSFGYCFGCGRSWDAISWLQDFEKMSFQQAIEFLAKR